MLYTISPVDMQQLEKEYMSKYEIPGALLMEHAALAVCDAIARHAPQGGRALFLCGPGNNGGDGYAAARIWKQRGGRCAIIELTGSLHGDAQMNRTLALQCGVAMLAADSIASLPGCDVIVDALFGTGLSRAPEGHAQKLIRLANDSGKPIVAVDIPSGLFGLDGHAPGDVICAAETVTFHRPKHGLLLGQGAETVGRLTVAPILIPQGEGSYSGMAMLTPEDIPDLLPPRPRSAHKGTFGKTVIFAGSRGMAGAAALSANAAVRSGSGLTTILCRESILPILQTLCPAAVCVPLPEADGCLTGEAAVIAAGQLKSASSAVIGCGLGQSDDLLPVLNVFRQATCPVIWDTDALNLLAVNRDLMPLPANAVVTPHPGEASRLLDCSIAQITADMPAALRLLHEATGAHVLLKDARTLMTDGSRVAVNPIGTPALSRGGSGDILTGILGALLAQQRTLNAETLTLMQLAAYLHAAAAIRASEALGEYCVTPEDVIRSIRLA